MAKNIKWAILVPALVDRRPLRERLMLALSRQIQKLPDPESIMILVNEDNGSQSPGGKRLGGKRNELIAEALDVKAKYISFFDDDDLPGPNYIKLNMEGINGGYDCCSLWGSIYFHGIKDSRPFHHSLDHDHWHEDHKFYYRMPNHLNAINLDKVKDIPFYLQDFGEDGRWSNDIRDAKRLKTEFTINETIYHYFTGRKDEAAMKVQTDFFNHLMAS